MRTALYARHQLFNFFGGLLGTQGQAAHFIGHNGKPTSSLTRPSCLDGRIKRQQIGLLRNSLDDVQDTADFIALLLQMDHRLGRTPHLPGQPLDLLDGFTDNLVAFPNLLIGGCRRLSSLTGVARHFLHGGGHFIHGGRDMIGLDFLAVGSCTGLLGDR